MACCASQLVAASAFPAIVIATFLLQCFTAPQLGLCSATPACPFSLPVSRRLAQSDVAASRVAALRSIVFVSFHSTTPSSSFRTLCHLRLSLLITPEMTNLYPPASFALSTQQLSNGTATLPVTPLARPTMPLGTVAEALRPEVLPPLLAVSVSDRALPCATRM